MSVCERGGGGGKDENQEGKDYNSFRTSKPLSIVQSSI